MSSPVSPSSVSHTPVSSAVANSEESRISALSADELAERGAATARNRAIAIWAAGKMDLNPDSTELYAQAVQNFHNERPTEEDVIRKIYGDLIASNVAVRESEVRTRAAEFLAQARESLKKPGNQ